MTFESLGLPPALAQALKAKNLEEPMPVQEAALPVLLARRSAMIVSRTGSGKTLAYLLPILAALDPESLHVQAVILAPTHELAMQIHRVATDLAREAGLGLRIQSLIGGAAVSRQIEGLKKKPHLVIGSAGRITHLLGLGKLKLRETAWMVLDEVDRLLIEEGVDHVRQITAELRPDACFVFVSATEGPAATRIAKGLAPNLEYVRVQTGISATIRHCYLISEERDKTEWLRKALRGLMPSRTLVFVHRGANAERISERLEFHKLSVADLHGARDKFARQAALDDFRKGQATVLIASDIAARGLDIAGVELVVNVDVPSQSRDYLHRAGRTGRAGAPGIVLSLMTEAESRLAGRYASELGITMERVALVRGTLVAAQDAPGHTSAPKPRKTGKATEAGTIGGAKPGHGKTPSPHRPKSGPKVSENAGKSRPERESGNEGRAARKRGQDEAGPYRQTPEGGKNTAEKRHKAPAPEGQARAKRRPPAAGATPKKK